MYIENTILQTIQMQRSQSPRSNSINSTTSFFFHFCFVLHPQYMQGSASWGWNIDKEPNTTLGQNTMNIWKIHAERMFAFIAPAFVALLVYLLCGGRPNDYRIFSRKRC